MARDHEKDTNSRTKKQLAVLGGCAYATIGAKGLVKIAAAGAVATMGISDLVEWVSIKPTSRPDNTARGNIEFGLPAKYENLRSLMYDVSFLKRLDMIVGAHVKKYGRYDFQPSDNLTLEEILSS